MAEIDKAIVAMLSEVEHIAKDKKNAQQGYNFRGIDDVYNAVHPLLSKHGVYPTCEIVSLEYQERETQKGGVLFYARGRFRYFFRATDGSSVSTEAIGEAMDSGDKASNKAMSNAYKYAIFQLLCIPTMAVDGDNDTHEGVLPQGKTASKLPASGTAAFGSNGPKPHATDTPPAAKVFSWPKASSEERKTYTISRIEAAKAERDPVKFKESLEKISKFLEGKGGQLTTEHWQEVSSALQAAEQVLMQELSGA